MVSKPPDAPEYPLCRTGYRGNTIQTHKILSVPLVIDDGGGFQV